MAELLLSPFNEWHWAHFSKSLWTSLFFSCVILLLILFYSSIGHKMHPDSLFVKSLPCSLSLFYCFHHHRSLVCLRERLWMCSLNLSYTVCVHIHTLAVELSSLLYLSWKHWSEPVAECVRWKYYSSALNIYLLIFSYRIWNNNNNALIYFIYAKPKAA